MCLLLLPPHVKGLRLDAGDDELGATGSSIVNLKPVDHGLSISEGGEEVVAWLLDNRHWLLVKC